MSTKKRNNVIPISTSLFLCLCSCGIKSEITNSNRAHDPNPYHIKNVNSEPSPQQSSGPELNNELMNSINKLNVDTSKDSQEMKQTEQQKHTLSYPNLNLGDLTPREYEAAGIIPGKIQVVLKDEYSLRIEKQGISKVSSGKELSLPSAASFNNLISNIKATAMYDMADGMTDKEVTEDLNKVKEHYKGHIPSRYSLITIEVPEDADLKNAIMQLRRAPFVHSANYVYKTDISAVTRVQVGRVDIHATNPPAMDPKPSDPLFTNATENTKWWWFRRHQVFNAWTVYGTTPMPTIAVIDSGFDTAAETIAIDKPNYLTGKRLLNCTTPASTSCTINDTDVSEPTHPTRNFSHGTMVASIAGSPKNNGKMLAGAAPNAPIYPIRIMKADTGGGTIQNMDVAAAIRHAKGVSAIDVINISLSQNNQCPLSMSDNNVKTEIASAISAGKIIVAAAGNGYRNLQTPLSGSVCDPSSSSSASSSTGGEIVVGGVANDTGVTPNRTKGWEEGWLGSNYDSTQSTNISDVDIAAAAQDIQAPWYDPNLTSSNRGTSNPYDPDPDGTSLASPIVAATAGMMKKIAAQTPSSTVLSHAEVKGMLVGSGNMSRYTGGYTSANETKFLGENMDYQSGGMIGVRSLNMHDALVLARYTKQYPVTIRLHNIDDVAEVTINNNWATKSTETYGYDKILGLSGIVAGEQVNFRTYNSGGGYAYGYSVYRGKQFFSQGIAGVSGVAGAELNANKPVGYYGVLNYTH